MLSEEMSCPVFVNRTNIKFSDWFITSVRKARLVTNLNAYNLICKTVFQPCLSNSVLCPKLSGNFTGVYLKIQIFMIPGLNAFCLPF